jgi:hypothetical protein
LLYCFIRDDDSLRLSIHESVDVWHVDRYNCPPPLLRADRVGSSEVEEVPAGPIVRKIDKWMDRWMDG